MNKLLILNKIKQHLEIKTNKDFAAFLEIKPTTLSMWYSRNTYDIELIFKKCEEIDANWLLTGEGNMLRNKDLKQNDSYKDKYLELLEENRDLNKEINILKGQIKTSDIPLFRKRDTLGYYDLGMDAPEKKLKEDTK